MLILAIESSGLAGSLALRQDGQLLAEKSLDPDSRHARSLIPELENLLKETGFGLSDCDAVGVSIGPGSFTGLRVGVVCAKVLCYATGAKLIAVETLRCIAHNAPPDVERLQVVMDAQRQELFVAEFVRTGPDSFDEGQPLRVQSAASWLKGLDPNAVVTGPGLEKLTANGTVPAHVLPVSFWNAAARNVALLSEQAFRAGIFEDPFALEPFYFRKSAAEEKRDAIEAAQKDPQQ